MYIIGMLARMLTTLALFLALGAPAEADPWTHADTVREVACTGVALVDYDQTLRIAADGNEINPALGTHPSPAAVTLYFAASIGLHYAVARVLPETWRAPFQYITFTWEAAFDLHNASIGYPAGLAIGVKVPL